MSGMLLTRPPPSLAWKVQSSGLRVPWIISEVVLMREDRDTVGILQDSYPAMGSCHIGIDPYIAGKGTFKSLSLQHLTKQEVVVVIATNSNYTSELSSFAVNRQS